MFYSTVKRDKLKKTIFILVCLLCCPVTVFSADTTYTVQQADLWDNGYDNVNPPRQSPLARFVFQTNATSISVTGTTNIYASYDEYAHLGIRIDGVDQDSLVFTGNGQQSFEVAVGTGETKTIEIVGGLQSTAGGATALGTFIDSVTYDDASNLIVLPQNTTNRVVVYGDSIAVGANAANAEKAGYVAILRNTYSANIMLEAWGYRTLYADCSTDGKRSTFASLIAGLTPAKIYLAIGTNDYAGSGWNAVDFGVAYADMLDKLNTAIPTAKIIAQTPLLRLTETENIIGSTTQDYRDQIAAACNARSSYCTTVDGTELLTLDSIPDGVHPSTAGHTTYAAAIWGYIKIGNASLGSGPAPKLGTGAGIKLNFCEYLRTREG